MKNRFLALLICAVLVFSIIPFGKNIKASQTNNAKQLNTPEQMAAVMREKANNNTARMKGKITQSQVNETIKQKLIVKTRDEIKNTYGANSVYYYTVGNYQILFYDTAEEAKNACEKLKKDLPGFTVVISADGNRKIRRIRRDSVRSVDMQTLNSSLICCCLRSTRS